MQRNLVSSYGGGGGYKGEMVTKQSQIKDKGKTQ